jgi:23S rRNA pseudouridine2604 synthase
MTDTGGERLSKRVAALAACSRREAEQYIAGGWVRVEGQVIEEPQHRVRQERVEIDGAASLMAVTPVTLLLHKVPGASILLKQEQQWTQDRSGLRLLKKHSAGLESVVPLEDAASGLLVFSQDWRILRRLEEDAAFLEHELMVDVAGEVSQQVLAALNQPLVERGQPLPQVKFSLNSTPTGHTRLRCAVKGSHPGLLAYRLERQGLHITGMKRVRIGRVFLATLPPGQWRFLLSGEKF